ncbi:hypothetical protein BS78_02G390800 [Paspalum vaginatum]|nr:hypothetical protein BS78_02G390800 [Paspalum vaginatum]
MDFLQFRAVCMPWRAGTPNPQLGKRTIDDSFHPREWILLPLPEAPAEATRRQLLNVTTRKLVQVHLPELAGHSVVEGPSGAPEGMLLLRDERTLVVRLLNPVTRHVVDLPSLMTLRRGRRTRRGRIPYGFKEDYKVTGAGFAGDYSTVVVSLGCINRMAVAKPGDRRWTLVNLDPMPEYPRVLATATSRGRFYCFDRQGLKVVDLARRRLKLVAATPASWSWKFSSFSLIDDDGTLVLVCGSSRIVPVIGLGHGQCRRVTVIELFHVDLEDEDDVKLLPILGIGEYAVFVGWLGGVLMPSAGRCCSAHANTVYFRFDLCQRDFCAFQLSTNCDAYGLPPVQECRFAREIASYVTTRRSA